MEPNAVPPQTPQRPTPFMGMWVGFMYILFFITLDLVSFAIAGIFHNWVDNAVPLINSSSNTDYSDPLFFMLYFGYEQAEITRGYIATIIVSLPVFMLLIVNLTRLQTKFPGVKLLRVRKILIYLTLILTFLILLSNAIYAIFNFLGGEFTMSLIGHLAVTFIITGGIFFYFFREVIHDQHPLQ